MTGKYLSIMRSLDKPYLGNAYRTQPARACVWFPRLNNFLNLHQELLAQASRFLGQYILRTVIHNEQISVFSSKLVTR